MISVIITVHEPLLKHLARCLASVLWQLAPEDEVLVVCDGLPAMRLVAECGVDDARIEVLSVTGGVSAARNRGLNRARNPWFKFLDADDLLAPFALNAARKALPKLDADVAVLCGAQVQVHNGIVTRTVQPPDVAELITRANPCLVSMTFVRATAAAKVGGFDPEIHFEEDWDFWLRLRQDHWRFARMQPPVCYYWVDDVERAAKQRSHETRGLDVREYLRRTYDINPIL